MFYDSEFCSKYLPSKKNLYNLFIMALVSFFIWYASFSAITGSFRKILRWLLYKQGEPAVVIYSKLVSRTQVSFVDLITVILSTYGQVITLSILTVSFIAYLYKSHYFIKIPKHLRIYYTFFSFSAVLFIVLSVLFFFNDFFIGFGRVLKYAIFFSSVFVAASFYIVIVEMCPKSRKRTFKVVVLCVVMILLTYFSIFNLYYSPIVKRENHQVPRAEFEGMFWFYENRETNMLIVNLGTTQEGFHNAIYGTSIAGENVRFGGFGITTPLDHFGYDEGTLLGEHYSDDTYLLISTPGRISYPKLHPKYEKYWRFTPLDFVMLDEDDTVLKIYDNNDFSVYYMCGVGHEAVNNWS